MKPREGALPFNLRSFAAGQSQWIWRRPVGTPTPCTDIAAYKARNSGKRRSMLWAMWCGENRQGKARRIGDTGQENTATALLPFKLTAPLRLTLRRPLPRLAALATLLCPCLRRIRELVMQAAAFPPAAPFAALCPI